MYRSSKNKIKESDLNLNNEIYPNYFGGAWMKIFSEKMSEFYSRLGRNKYTVIRHSNVYGPHDKFDEKKKMVLFCALGFRSDLATKTLTDMGFKNVAHVSGGFESLKN